MTHDAAIDHFHGRYTAYCTCRWRSGHYRRKTLAMAAQAAHLTTIQRLETQ